MLNERGLKTTNEIQWKQSNVITYGQTETDDINWLMINQLIEIIIHDSRGREGGGEC
jgi:hypothetical protein